MEKTSRKNGWANTHNESSSDMGRVPVEMERHPECHDLPTSKHHMLFQSAGSFYNGLTRKTMINLLPTQALGFCSLYFAWQSTMHPAECSPVVYCQTSYKIPAKPRESLADKSKDQVHRMLTNHFTRMRFPVLGLVPEPQLSMGQDHVISALVMGGPLLLR